MASIARTCILKNLGVAFIAPFLTVLITTGLCTWIGKYMRSRQMDWVAATETRVTSVSYVVGCIKGVRMLGLSDSVLRMLTNLRELEVEAHKHIRKLLVWVLVISNVIFQTTTLVTYVTFAAIALSKPTGLSLDFNVLYGSLSALKLVTSPMVLVLQLIPSIQGSLASLDRIQNFLMSESIDDVEEELIVRHETHEGIELPPLRKRNFIVSIKDAIFGVDAEKPLLFDISMSCQIGSLTMVVGKVGSGKSVLLRSLVGEAKLLGGSFKPLPSGTAFCDQSIWLRNATIRDNIIGEDVFDESWYNKVLWSCNLTQDLDEMKKGDLTPIGTKGISLSGGQKNRMSLARALYARKPILAIDDMLAGLDSTTEKLVFDRVFGRNGLLRKANATVILATHATYFARHADQIIVLSEGRIVENGTYQELIARKVNFNEINASARDDMPEVDSIERASNESLKTISPKVKVQEEEEEEQDDEARRAGDGKSLMFFMKAVGTFHNVVYFGLLAITTVATTIQCKSLNTKLFQLLIPSPGGLPLSLQ
jgi:ATP-binding cassette subfamily C (CFTR/MRP) protein 1